MAQNGNRQRHESRKNTVSLSDAGDQLREAFYTKDGEGHLNVNRSGETEFGRLLAIDWRGNFSIPNLGSFTSPRAFVCWLYWHDDEYRHTPPPGIVRGMDTTDYHMLLAFAKYYHLLRSRNMVHQHFKAVKKIPWTSYSTAEGGFYREYHRWTEYPNIVRGFCERITKYETSLEQVFAPQVLEALNEYLCFKAEHMGLDFVPYEELVKRVNTKPPHERTSIVGVSDIIAPRPPRSQRQKGRRPKPEEKVKSAPTEPVYTSAADLVEPLAEALPEDKQTVSAVVEPETSEAAEPAVLEEPMSEAQ
ncbi:MAG: hypothetical protein PHN51_11585 [Candidatus Nanopelagicales bacterium]|nr:hypothetical protein [Candidatus Nanopelagicales bacterium]